MSETKQFLKIIRPLKLVINPLFFIIVNINATGFSKSKLCTFFVFCAIFLAFFCKTYLKFRCTHWEFEDYLENYASLGPMLLCSLSYIGFVVKSKAITQALCQIISKQILISDKDFNRKVHKIIVLQVIISHAVPISFFIWIYYATIVEESNFLFILGQIFIDYFISMHFSATSLIFSNALFFWWKLVTEINEQIQQIDQFEPIKPHMPSENSFLKQEGITRIRVADANENLVDIIMNYDWTCQWCEDFNEIFGLPLAALFMSNLISTIMYAFYLTKYGIVELWLFLIGGSYCILQSWIILYACEKFKKEVRRTGIIVNRFIIKTKNQNLKEKLQQFSGLLLNRKVHFTACGLFDLNYKLMYSALTAVAAYLAIAFQFELASRTSSRNSYNFTLNR